MHLETIERSAQHLAALPDLSDVLGHPLITTMNNWFVWSRFWQQIVCMVSTRCWVWNGKVDGNGYGRVRARGTDGGVANAHRMMFTWLVGPIPFDMTLDHLCRNTACVNPEHLEIVSRGENSRRARTKERCIQGHQLAGSNLIATSKGGRRCRACAVAYSATRHRTQYQPVGPRTHCKWGHEFTPENTRITSQGIRQCRACGNRRDRERYANDPQRKASVKLRASNQRENNKH